MSDEENGGFGSPWWFVWAGSFFSALSAAGLSAEEAADLGRALALLVNSPLRFAREYLWGVIAVRIIDGILSMVAAAFTIVLDAFDAIGSGLVSGLIAPLFVIGSTIRQDVLRPMIDIPISAVAGGLESLGVAAPLAALFAAAVTTVLATLLAVAIYELLRTYLPVRALTRPLVEVAVVVRSAIGRPVAGALAILPTGDSNTDSARDSQ